MTALAGAIAARLVGKVNAWQIYTHGVPDGPLPQRYIVVWGAPGDESASTVSDATDMREPVAWVTSVCRFPDGQFAATEVNASSARVRDALRDWRPSLGRVSWKCRNVSSGAGRRDESLPDTVFSAVEGFTALYQASLPTSEP